MSTDNNTQSPMVSQTVRKPVLIEKYSKFIQFGYYMMSQMDDTDSFNKDEFMTKLKVFAPVDEQQAFIQGFLDNQKVNKTNMRNTVLAHYKASQPKKEKAVRKTKAKNNNDKNKQKQAAAVGTDSQENLIETMTNELTEEPMINKITSAIELANDLTAKKGRTTKKKTTANTDTDNTPPPPPTTDDDVNQLSDEVTKDLSAVAEVKKGRITKKKATAKTDENAVDENQLIVAMDSLNM
jgi:hypothetical protein